MSGVKADQPSKERYDRTAERSTSLPSLDIVIVNWNAGTYLRDCLEAVAESKREHFELDRVVVVDNGSDDG